jgi:hypothetical protein
MLFEPDREALRLAWARAWHRCRKGVPLEPLEAAIADVVAEHPEYQNLLENLAEHAGGAEDDPAAALARTWTPADGEANPFLHMGLHLALREQAATDRPPGIRAIRHRLVGSAGSVHAAEHRMMEVLGRILWDAQQAGRPPDETAYLDALRRLAGA